MDTDQGMREADRVNAFHRLPLYWQVCLINGLVFIVGTAVLAASPATISPTVVVSEAIILTIGIAVILSTNFVLLRASLSPIDRLIGMTESVDLQQPGRRLPETGNGPVSQLVRSFNSMLDRLEVERRTANARALAAQEAERGRIAQELHDEVGQGLTAVLLGLRRSADRATGDLADELHTVLEIARSSLTEVQDVARRLRPGVLEDLGLASALAALATDFSHGGLQVRRGIAPGLPVLDPDTELVIYRVAQESLTNVARHAGAETVTLSLSLQGDAVALRIADEGHGLQDRPEGSGIRGMRERALLIGGRLTIGPRVGGGTEVRLVVPARSTA